MLRFFLVALIIVLQHETTLAQWRLFQPVRIDLVPEDQRDIDGQTVEDGKVTNKEIRVDWYGFTLKGDTNEVDGIFVYPVSDPMLRPGDKIVKIGTQDVSTGPEVNDALRKTASRPVISISIVRIIEGKDTEKRITLYRANSLVLNELIKEKHRIQPPRLHYGVQGSWGRVSTIALTVSALTDDGVPVYSGTIDTVKVENVILVGWPPWNAEVGREYKPPIRGANVIEPDEEAAKLAMETGSSASPKENSPGGGGFLFGLPSNSRNRPSNGFSPGGEGKESGRYIVGIGKPKTLRVDGKPLKINVLLNLE